MSRPPLPPFNAETAATKARMAEDAWNTREPTKIALAYTEDSVWRNRSEFVRGRAEIEAFLTVKWTKELDYRNDLPIDEADRKYHWPLGRRPDDHPGLSDLGL